MGGDIYKEAALGRHCKIAPEDRIHGGAHVPALWLMENIMPKPFSELLVGGEIPLSTQNDLIRICESARFASLTNAAAFEEAVAKTSDMLGTNRKGVDLGQVFASLSPNCPRCDRYKEPINQ